ncbi:SLAP domain-containing protein [Lactobacillus bombicola]|uniref:Cell surface protein n=1 Tax=Lactobacillus bombicola TaxID=1505723 RepID=A0A396STE7_9LACO|nr:SLAP domain-containing protein [Lactobacillus bombicola]RHW54906.1 cell surface protein [Lactobacillus bombicola]
MKKNLRIVSAAAAALLAVAPVATSVVSTVSADTNVTVEGGTTSTAPAEASIKLNVTNVASLVANDSPAKVAASIATPSLPTGAAVVPAKANVYKVTKNTDGTNSVATTPTTDKLVAGESYVVKVKVSITGLTSFAGKSATDAGAFKVNGTAVTVNGSGIATDVELTSADFAIPNPALTGAPYIKDVAKSSAVDSGSIDLTTYSVAGIKSEFDKKYAVANTTTGTGAAIPSITDFEGSVRAGLKAAGITVKADGSFDKPAASFPITLNLASTNGKTNTFVFTVNPSATTSDDSFPFMFFNGETDTAKAYKGNATIDALPDSITWNYVPVNGVVDTKGIQNSFKTTVSKTDTNTIVPTVDISKVNTKVAGKYPVTVTATNAEKKTTKVTFMLTVGAKDASYKIVQSDVDVPVYKITGNTVTDTKTVVKNGDQIATYGDAIVINGKSYTRINSADSDLYVETKYVDGSVKPGDKVTKKVMHNAYIYDANHKRVGDKTLAAYTNVDVYGKATKLADGSLVYKIGDDQYVMADNIDGTVRTLTHNAYVYKTSTKRADRRVLRKGDKVTTYGNPYKFKNGKSYYRIGGPAKQYVKVANF